VLADAAGAGGDAAAGGAGPAEVAEAALTAGQESLERTREVLPALRNAGVVDAGGRGIVLLLDALAATLGGHDLTVEVGPPGPVGRTGVAAEAVTAQKFEVMYLLQVEDDRVSVLTEALTRLGDSVVVVGGGGLFKVHVHTDEAGAAVEAGLDHGRPRSIEIVDLAGQVAEHCVAGQARAVRVADEQASAMVAVADGDGLAAIFRSLGAVVVSGGPGRNPSVGELAEAVFAAPAPAVLVLPNHRNVRPAAERALDEAGKEGAIIPAASVPQGLAAAAAFNPMVSLEENVAAMTGAAEGCVAGSVVRAVRDADTPAGPVRAGEWLGLAGDEVAAHGKEAADVAIGLIGSMRDHSHELLTLIVGADPSEEEAASVSGALRKAAAGLEVEVHRGGQPGFAYLVGLE
jgi:uncharacterized protein